LVHFQYYRRGSQSNGQTIAFLGHVADTISHLENTDAAAKKPTCFSSATLTPTNMNRTTDLRSLESYDQLARLVRNHAE